MELEPELELEWVLENQELVMVLGWERGGKMEDQAYYLAVWEMVEGSVLGRVGAEELRHSRCRIGRVCSLLLNPCKLVL
jgi:hypothetical protein